MGKVKMKRKSTRIDMTAMSDVTVLLLTFFMLTSTFLQKEPATVVTPSSVSEIKVPMTNVSTVLVSPEGNVFVGVTGEADMTIADGKWATDSIRREIFVNAINNYERFTGKSLNLTGFEKQQAIEQFAKMNMFGVPFDRIPEFFRLKSSDQEDWLAGKGLGKGTLANVRPSDVGIPMTDITYRDEEGNLNTTNEFQIWMRAIYNSGNENLQNAMRKGEGIAVKADHSTRYDVVHNVLDNLQTIKYNRFTVMTALKTNED
ncbi:MAG: biopolymer transporter ExbD [Muribaculaceae bacterium]|nr:biopolymer transporter ExbD [Muribaculaceae bacterium]